MPEEDWFQDTQIYLLDRKIYCIELRARAASKNIYKKYLNKLD